MIGLKRHTVQVVGHQRGWAALAADTCQKVQLAGGDLLADVQHMGSTAVPGLPAKPILDLVAGVRTLEAIPELIGRLTNIGYLYRGDGGVDGRHLFVKESSPDVRTIHLHVVTYNGQEWRSCLRFRDRLRQDARIRTQYAELKRKLGITLQNDRKAYTAAKEGFIRAILRGTTPAQPSAGGSAVAPRPGA